MTKPPRDLVDGFCRWFEKDPHKEHEDYYRDVLTRDSLATMTKEDFVEFIVEFVAEGGKIQSGGHRTKNLFRETVLENYDGFRLFILRAFDADLDVHAWLRAAEDFKYFGRGIATIFLNRIDKRKYVVVNNKSAGALALFQVRLPADIVKRYEVVKAAQGQLLTWYPEFDNYYRTDALTHYLIGIPEGKLMAEKYLSSNLTYTDPPRPIRFWVEKTYVKGVADREEGPYALGQALLSPQKAKDSKDIYRFMREVAKGDVIIHVVDDAVIPGVSKVLTDLDDTYKGPPFDGNDPWYLIGLEGFSQLAPPIERSDYLTNPEQKVELELIRKSNSNLFYNNKLELSQGAYLTPAPAELINLLNNVYRNKTGRNLPYCMNMQTATKTAESEESYGKRYWVCGLGEGAKHWDECRQKNIAVFGFDRLPDLSTFNTKDEVAEAIEKADGRTNAFNDILAAWQIPHEIKPGDILIAKRGTKTYLGYGVVTGGFYYDASRPSYRNILPVEWKKTGEWEETQGKIPIKTLTDITPYPEYVQRLMKMMEINAPETFARVVNLPQNLILYGPPGTGKTHKLRDQYFKLFTDQRKRMKKSDFAEEIAANTGWWEITAMVMLDLKSANVSMILEHPLMAAKIKLMQNKSPRAAIWAQLQSHTKLDCPNVNYTRRFEPLVFWKDENSVWSVDATMVESELKEVNDKLQSYLTFTDQETIEKRYVFTTFHQSYSYEEFVEGIKPRLGEEATEVAGEVSYEIKPGVFKQIVERANRDPEHPYAIFIDEISRGNVASIFGELITLIEDDKRRGAENAMSAVLPYSREEFSVPGNLHIIGTMNTADRSVIALDNALRRRFCFEELMPNVTAIVQPEDFEVDLRTLLTTINGRIERLLDRDHVIGHSYFMGIAGAPEPLRVLQEVFANKVLPLLHEYFYGDPAKIGMVLGDAFVKADGNGTPFAPGVWQDDVYEDRQVLRFISPYDLDVTAFLSIYEA